MAAGHIDEAPQPPLRSICDPDKKDGERKVLHAQVVGTSDKIGAAPAERRISPEDLATTLHHFLGIDSFLSFLDYHDRQGRTFKVLDEGQIVRELIS